MRIKIIGDNNCARATRHLLRMAGFALVEFLPVEAVTQAPHGGFAITIDGPTVPTTGQTPAVSVPDFRTLTGLPASAPDYSTINPPATCTGETSAFARVSADVSLLASGGVGEGEGKQAEACATGGAYIHFDSVDSVLEAAVLRHVTQLATAPVIVDRPGGRVRSERELRIVLPCTGDAKADEAAAVAVEFGVLRGLLDIVFAKGGAGKMGEAAVRSGAEREKTIGVPGKLIASGGKKWWRFGLFGLAATLVGMFSFVEIVHAGRGSLLGGSRIVGAEIVGVGVGDGAWGGLRGCDALRVRIVGGWTEGRQAETFVGGWTKGKQAEACSTLRALGLARFAGQGQVSTGQQTRIGDGANTLVVDPCKGQTKLYVSINQTANTQLVAGTASKKIHICSIHVVVSAATNVALVEGTGSVCGTGTAGVSGFGGATAATGWNFAANGGIVLGNGDSSVGAQGTSADNLCLFNSAAGQVSGGISYVVQ